MLSQAPRTREELAARERAEDAEALVRETWAHYAQRTGRHVSDDDDAHVKHVDETWAAYEARKAAQRAYIDACERAADDAAMRHAARQREAARRSDAVVARLTQHQRERDAQRLPPRHGLHVDFDALQHTLAACERRRTTAAETLLREHIERWRDALHACMHHAAVAHARVFMQRQREREQRESDARARAAAEAKRDAEAAHARELQRRREQQERQQRLKDEAEQTKRAERRRRDEERRARRRSELAIAATTTTTM